ncbi:MAG: MarR family transcriptional regulator [Kiritimatiellae bacterium]|nr:MarR family transcriptional regulator [Kiritimatiellia bacterium]
MASSRDTNEIEAILTTGKRIRDYMCRAQMEVLGTDPALASMRELTLQQMATAMITLERGPLSLNQLAHMLGVSPASASTMVDRLIEKDVLTRHPSQEDRRKIVIRIADETGKKLSVVQKAMRSAMDRLTAQLGRDTTHQWFDVMGRIGVALDVLELDEREIHE